MLRAQVRRFVEEEVKPHALQWEEQGHVPRETLRRMGELGFLGIRYPAEYGGAEMDTLASVVFAEELGRSTFSGFAITVLVHTDMASVHIAHAGSKAQRDRYMADVIAGRKIVAVAVTEPGAGSDVKGIRTTARRDGDSYVINGAKTFITNGVYGDLYCVAAKTDPGSRSSQSVSMLLVEKGTPGLSFGAQEKKLGWKSQPTAMVMFENCRVPAENLIGREGEGFAIAMKGLDGGRLNIAACSIGGAQFCLDRTIEYMRERKQFGTRLSDFQALRFRLADYATELEAARLMVRRAAHAVSEGEPGGTRLAAMAKRLATDIGFEAVNGCLQLHGGYGYLRDHPIERVLRDVRVHQILEGTNEVMRLIVSRDLLGN